MKIVFIVPSDDRDHYCTVGSIAFIGVYEIGSGIPTYYPLDLIDVLKSDSPVFDPSEVILTTDKRLFDRFFPGLNSYDINTQFWLLYNQELINWQELDIFKRFKKFYYSYRNRCRYIPFVHYKAIFETIVETVLKSNEIYEITQSSRFYSEKVYKSIQSIEQAGLTVSLNEFNNVFSKNYISDIVRCYYKLHTTTGRPSNTFDTINYSALNKKDGSRSVFVSRFKDKGVLLEFDLDAYHLRLIAQIINYPLPESSVHEYFGKKYFKTDNLTSDQYQESKAISFRILYGGLTKEYSDIQFFQQVEDLKSSIWEEFIAKKQMTSPISGKVFTVDMFTDMNKSKLFNYILQTVETEYSILFIEEILNILNNKSSKLVLYTYDSFLIDFCLEDGKDTVFSISNTLKNCKVKVGSDYHNLIPYNVQT